MWIRKRIPIPDSEFTDPDPDPGGQFITDPDSEHWLAGIDKYIPFWDIPSSVHLSVYCKILGASS
jgi:hypothetical protein